MAGIESTQKRIFMWTCPRSLSTAFYRAITNAPGTLGIFEPYSSYLGYGPTKNAESTSTFMGITAKLNEIYKDYDTIFAKDVAYCFLSAPHSIEDILPEGYIHTFLIRDPRKSVPSLYKPTGFKVPFSQKVTGQECIQTSGGDRGDNNELPVVFFPGFLSLLNCVSRSITGTGTQATGWTDFNWNHGGHKASYELYTYMTQDLGLTCLVLDADDLQDNPESTIKAYCDFVGIPFHQSMVHWNMADSSRLDAFKEVTGGLFNVWYTNASNTSTFNGSNTRSTLGVTSHPPIVQETINKLMPYYQRMYDKRLVVNSSQPADDV